MKNSLRLLLCALPLSALALHAAPADDATLPPPPPEANMSRGDRPPPPPLVGALDANHDGVISADEIATAPAALRTLDKNGDGQLTPDEFHPARPPHGRPHRPRPDRADDAPPPSH